MTAPDLPMRERIAEALAHARCRETNPKADHPVFGYAAFSEDQREHLRAQQYDAADAVLAVLADLSDTAVEAGAKALAAWDGADGWGTPEWSGEIPEFAYLNGAGWSFRAAIAAIKEGKA